MCMCMYACEISRFDQVTITHDYTNSANITTIPFSFKLTISLKTHINKLFIRSFKCMLYNSFALN